MASPRRTFKPKSVPDGFVARITAAVENFEVGAAAAQLTPADHKRLRAIVDEWVTKSVEMRVLGVTPTKRDYRLFMLKRLGLH